MLPFDKLDDLAALDPLSEKASAVITKLPVGLRDLLHGTWLGHPLHPAVAQLPVGSMLSATALDLLGGEESAVRVLAWTGLVTAVPAALTGATDWAESGSPDNRAGLVHAWTNTVGLSLWLGSLMSRRRGGSGKLLGAAGTAVLGLSAAIGGHVAYRRGIGADQTASIPRVGPTDWTVAGPDVDLTEGTPVRRVAGETPVLLVRQGDHIDALADECAHKAGPLSDGEVQDGCVTCPWHGSVFRLADGAVVHGPSVHPQKTLDVRVQGDRLQVKLRS